MKKNLAAGLALCVSMLFASGNLYAFDEVAKNLFDNGQYEECIQRVKSKPDLQKQRDNVMLLAFSNYQLYKFTNQKTFDKEFDSFYDLLRKKVEVDDLKGLLFFVNSSDKPEVVKSSRELLKAVFKSMHKIDEIVKIIPFADSTDKKTRELAFDTMVSIMKPIRTIVKKGGTMRPIDVVYFQNKGVIQSAMENIDISAARAVLVLIEEPALEIIDSSNDPKLKDISEDITDAVNGRKKAYPNSLWYSATGKQVNASGLQDHTATRKTTTGSR
jgi:hypothetical protein